MYVRMLHTMVSCEAMYSNSMIVIGGRMEYWTLYTKITWYVVQHQVDIQWHNKCFNINLNYNYGAPYEFIKLADKWYSPQYIEMKIHPVNCKI